MLIWIFSNRDAGHAHYYMFGCITLDPLRKSKPQCKKQTTDIINRGKIDVCSHVPMLFCAQSLFFMRIISCVHVVLHANLSPNMIYLKRLNVFPGIYEIGMNT